ncbi:MAG: GNAT family N-acetyltransferase [Phycisphaerales bacterium]|nr:GNAT family N-acetyltransferase [Phycisphaerales bacterium]
MAALTLQVRFELAGEERSRWIRFWEEASRSHPRQHPEFAAVVPTPQHRTLFVSATRDGELAFVGQFTLRPSPLLGGGSLEALCRRGPLIAEPSALAELTPLLAARLGGLHVGRLRITPRWMDGDAVAIERVLTTSGWTCEGPARVGTGVVEVGRDTSTVLASFSQSTRAQIRLAERRGVAIEPASSESDSDQFYSLLEEMCRRRALPRLSRYEHDATMAVLRRQGLGVLLVARYAGQIVGGVSVLRDSNTAYPARYALSCRLPESLRTVRLGAPLFWSAMQWAAAQGCSAFDVEGYDPARMKTSGIAQIDAFKAGFRPRPVHVLGSYVRNCFLPFAIADKICVLLRRASDRVRRLSSRRRDRLTSFAGAATPEQQSPRRRAGKPLHREKATTA